ncbi:MAG: hypothetical protein KGH75_09890 [Rhodospirillales bacterium]|nr:hypothetical protein [Rhodospirillales bacterium]
MKFYGDAPYANMDMQFDQLQHDLLVAQIKKHNIKSGIETGTHLGLGSTKNIAKAFLEAGETKDVNFISLEANHLNFAQAKKNLEAYEFIYPVLGSSCYRDSIVEFLQNDPVLQHPEHYPEIYIDFRDSTNAAQNYISESIGAGDTDLPDWDGFGLLPQWLQNQKDDHVLIVLDSAGGLGWLEFSIVLQYSRPYTLLLDDVEHVKHFRSLEYIKNPAHGFKLLGSQNGWALAERG